MWHNIDNIQINVLETKIFNKKQINFTQRLSFRVLASAEQMCFKQSDECLMFGSPYQQALPIWQPAWPTWMLMTSLIVLVNWRHWPHTVDMAVVQTVTPTTNYSQENIQLFIDELILESKNRITRSLVKQLNISGRATVSVSREMFSLHCSHFSLLFSISIRESLILSCSISSR